MTQITGRYAPSPTGRLHLGNLRTAMACWLQARLSGGKLLLRMDDLDRDRVKPGAAEQILEDLHWLGLDWDGDVVIQSEREDIYNDAFERLRKADLVFPCVCSRKDIRQAASTPTHGEAETVYPGTCRPANGGIDSANTKPVAWRFLAEDRTLDYLDEVLGRQSANLAISPGDFVVRRKDGITAYQLASVVDDGLLGITDVVRGADLADSTARQLALFDAIGFQRPRFWHVPLMNDASGKKLSKRDGSDSLAQLVMPSDPALGAEVGQTMDPPAVIGLLAHSLRLQENAAPTALDELLDTLKPTDVQQRLKAAIAESS